MEQVNAKVRLHVEGELAAGGTVGLSHTQAHYLKHVMRLSPGDPVIVFNGRDGEWLARIDGFGKGWASLGIETQRRPQAPEPDLWLAFAPVKRARLDFLVEKATELGVSALIPVFTRHTIVSRVNRERLQANALEAAEQTERLSVPKVWEPVSLETLMRDWGRLSPGGRPLLLCDESGGGRPIAQALAEAEPGPWALLTGPEGGFARAELDLLRDLPFVTPVGLGPRVLRADTAALAGLAVWQALVGDWHGRPAFRAQD